MDIDQIEEIDRNARAYGWEIGVRGGVVETINDYSANNPFIHKDWRERAGLHPAFPDMQLGLVSLKEAVYMCLGAASTCWKDTQEGQVFESEKAASIGSQLMERIHQAGPIYD